MKYRYLSTLIAALISAHMYGQMWEITYRENGMDYIDKVREPTIIVNYATDYNKESYDKLGKILYLSPCRLNQ